MWTFTFSTVRGVFNHSLHLFYFCILAYTSGAHCYSSRRTASIRFIVWSCSRISLLISSLRGYVQVTSKIESFAFRLYVVSNEIIILKLFSFPNCAVSLWLYSSFNIRSPEYSLSVFLLPFFTQTKSPFPNTISSGTTSYNI